MQDIGPKNNNTTQNMRNTDPTKKTDTKPGMSTCDCEVKAVNASYKTPVMLVI